MYFLSFRQSDDRSQAERGARHRNRIAIVVRIHHPVDRVGVAGSRIQKAGGEGGGQTGAGQDILTFITSWNEQLLKYL